MEQHLQCHCPSSKSAARIDPKQFKVLYLQVKPSDCKCWASLPPSLYSVACVLIYIRKLLSVCVGVPSPANLGV